MRVLFSTALDARDGYGYAAEQLMLEASKTLDICVEPISIWYAPQSLKKETQNLILKPTSKIEDNQIIFFYPTANLTTRSLNAFNITMYEAHKCPNEWVKTINRRGVPIIAPSKFVQEMFIDSGVKVPVYYIPFGVNQDFWAYKKREFPTDRKFRFLMVGKMEPRKNSLFTVETFLKAFHGVENVELIVKTRERFLPKEIYNIAAKDGRVKIIDRTLGELELKELYYQSDAFIYLSRGEGFSFPPRFAIATGMPTIVTGWSALDEIPGALKVDVTNFSPMPTCGFSYGQEKELLMANPSQDSAIHRMQSVFEFYEDYLQMVKQITWGETVEQLKGYLV